MLHLADFRLHKITGRIKVSTSGKNNSMGIPINLKPCCLQSGDISTTYRHGCHLACHCCLSNVEPKWTRDPNVSLILGHYRQLNVLMALLMQWYSLVDWPHMLAVRMQEVNPAFTPTYTDIQSHLRYKDTHSDINTQKRQELRTHMRVTTTQPACQSEGNIHLKWWVSPLRLDVLLLIHFSRQASITVEQTLNNSWIHHLLITFAIKSE